MAYCTPTTTYHWDRIGCMNGPISSVFGFGGGESARDKRKEIGTGFQDPPSYTPFSRKGPISTPDPVTMPSPQPVPMPIPEPPGVTADGLPAKPVLVEEVERALQESDVPKWVKALSKPFDALNPADKTRLEDLVAGRDTPTGQATEVYDGDTRSKPKKSPDFGDIEVQEGLSSENPRDGRASGPGWF